MEFTDAQIGAWVGSFLWPFFRVASFLMVVPVVGTQLVPMRVRLGLSFLITLIIAPLIGDVPQVEAISFDAFYIILQQVFIGTLMGFVFVLLMQLFVVAGQMVAMQMGLGFASMIDPTNGVNVPILSQIFLVSVTLVFLSINGHLVMIEVAVESFYVWPVSSTIVGPGSVRPEILWEFIMRINWLFASALLVALPVITAVLIINISFGVMTRAAPQMNVFSLGFPIGMLFGLFILWVSTRELGLQFQRFSEQTFIFLHQMQGAN
jgi:flagellar biosynthetic protein FliR